MTIALIYNHNSKFKRMEPQPPSEPSKNNAGNNQNIEQNLHRKFRKFMSMQCQENLNKGLRNFYGKNYTIRYKPEYRFCEQWEGKGMNEKQQQLNLLQQNGAWYFTFSLVFMVLNIASIWALSVERYFGAHQISQQSHIFAILVAFTLTDVALNAYFHYTITESHQFRVLRELRAHKKHILICLYFLYSSLQPTDSVAFYFVEAFVTALLFAKAQQIYKCIKVTELSLKYENQIKIMDLLFNVLIQAHVFAVILFSASKLNPQKNWASAIGIDGEEPFAKYVYSFYFASTTMLTIGYGDITPKSAHEIIVTVLIEIVGVVSFGYMLNEMGHTLSKMREQSEQLQRDLQTISKISKYYNLERKLQNRAKNFLFSNQVRSEELKVEEQNRVLMKLNEELRQQINHENSLTVVKSCIFFLCHWSKNMQSEIAKRLQRRLFAPNQKLITTNGSLRVYIIKHGRIDVFMNRYGSNKEYKKLLKVISTDHHTEVADNIYGYTTAFSNRPVRLEAIAKEFTSTYSVNSEEFLECMRQNRFDFEYYHEVKSRIDQSSFCEEWEAPAIKNIREHYSPSRIIIIKKFRRSLQSQQNKNKRKCFIRRGKYNCAKLLESFTNRIQSQNATNDKTIVFTTRKLEKGSQQLDSINQFSSSEQSGEQDYVKQSYEQAIATIKTKSFTIACDERQNKLKIAHNFQTNKEFYNFFKRNNLSSVFRSFYKENFMERNVGSDQPKEEKQDNVKFIF